MKYTINGRALADDQRMSIAKKVLKCHMKGIDNINNRHKNIVAVKVDGKVEIFKFPSKKAVTEFIREIKKDPTVQYMKTVD